MKINKTVSAIFYLGAIYDGLLGILFLFMPNRIFEFFNVTPPNHYGYVQFPGALLIVFAIMFFNVAYNPLKNRNLIPYGILLKASYCSVVFWYWFFSSIPYMWKPFAIFDLIFGILFVWAYSALGKK